MITAISLLLGGLLGLLAGYYGGLVDMVISGIIDLFWGFPLILVAVLLVGAIGPGLSHSCSRSGSSTGRGSHE